MIFCTNCGHKMADSFDFCPECGAKVVAVASNAPLQNKKTKVCPECHQELPPDASYCFDCHAVFPTSKDCVKPPMQYSQPGDLKDKWVALILCIVLGVYGAHLFYEGKIGMGILYLFTLGLFGVGWIADIFRILSYPNKYRVK